MYDPLCSVCNLYDFLKEKIVHTYNLYDFLKANVALAHKILDS